MVEKIITHPQNEKYRKGWDRAFLNKEKDKIEQRQRRLKEDRETAKR